MFNSKISNIIDTLEDDDYCCFYQSGSKETWSWIKAGALRKPKKEDLMDHEFIAMQREFLGKKHRKSEESLKTTLDK